MATKHIVYLCSLLRGVPVRGRVCACVCVIKKLMGIIVQVTAGQSHRLRLHTSQLNGRASKEAVKTSAPTESTPEEMSRISIFAWN